MKIRHHMGLCHHVYQSKVYGLGQMRRGDIYMYIYVQRGNIFVYIYICIYIFIYIYIHIYIYSYIFVNIYIYICIYKCAEGLTNHQSVLRVSSLLYGSFAKETYNHTIKK